MPLIGPICQVHADDILYYNHLMGHVVVRVCVMVNAVADQHGQLLFGV